MSYDIYLTERATGARIELPVKHIMTGGTYRADYDEATNTFSPAKTSEAWLNITYNYAPYYYGCSEGDSRFCDDSGENLGIRAIYGKSGAKTIPMLRDLASKIEETYKKNGEWISTKRKITIYRDKNGNEREPIELFVKKLEYTKEEKVIDVNEGPNEDYWTSTAANAIKPLYQLIAFAELRPDGVWDGD